MIKPFGSSVARSDAPRPSAPSGARVLVVDNSRGDDSTRCESVSIPLALRIDDRELSRIVTRAADVLAIVDKQGRILEVNRQGRIILGYTPEEVSRLSIFAIDPDLDGEELRELRRQMKNGACVTVERRFQCKDGSILPVEIRMGVVRIDGLGKALLVAARDITERNRSRERMLDDHRRTAKLGVSNDKTRATVLRLSTMLDRAQEEEQRRLAGELHDGMGQNVAALIVNLTLLRRHTLSLVAPARRALRECLALAKLCSREVRTAAYRLHPPLLEIGGLKLALRHFAREFTRRSTLRIKLDLPSQPFRLPSGMELTLFRTARECLLNVHHHSGSPRANVSLRVTPAKVRLEVRDRGRGLPARLPHGNVTTFSQFGVGLMGMAERIRQLGGNLSIKSNGRGRTGATVVALIPLKRARDQR